MEPEFADRKDNQCLPGLPEGLTRRLRGLHLGCGTVLADAGYSAGANYALLEERGITAFIPPHGTYKGGPEGFSYDREGDCWVCPQGKKATFRKVKVEPKNNIRKKVHLTTRKDCKGCPLRESCLGKGHEKKVEITYYREEYERAIARLKSRYGRKMKGLRQATVEPVLGTLINFTGLRKINTRGLELARKGMLLAASAYNLRKLLRFTPKTGQSAVTAMPRPVAAASLWLFWRQSQKELERYSHTSKEELLYPRVVQQLPMLGGVLF